MTTNVWQECRIRLVTALVLVDLFLPVWLAWLTESRPESDLRDQFRENLPLFCGMLLFVLIPTPALKSPGTLPEHQMLCLRYAARTGLLPLASLFTDWTTELKGWRRGLEIVLKALPATTLISAGSSIYIAATVPGSCAYLLMAASLSVFLGILLIKLIEARLRNICSIEEQLQLQKRYLATSVTKL